MIYSQRVKVGKPFSTLGRAARHFFHKTLEDRVQVTLYLYSGTVSCSLSGIA